VSETLIDVDDELLAQVQHILGTDTKKATVNGALREVVRRWAVVEFGHLARSGLFAGMLDGGPAESGEPECR
jgi:Arc/MetJ family transcription regulator